MKRKYLVWTGSLSIILFFVISGIVASYNPWFSIWKNAYSDLGLPFANKHEIFNYSLIFIISPLMGIFAVYLIIKNKAKIQVIASTLILVASFFIALIGFYPKNTKPHDFVAFYFFFFYFVGILLYGIKNKKKIFFLSSSLFILFWIGFLIPFPSIAMAENYALILIFIFTSVIAFLEK